MTNSTFRLEVKQGMHECLSLRRLALYSVPIYLEGKYIGQVALEDFENILNQVGFDVVDTTKKENLY